MNSKLPKIKICGVTGITDALAIAGLKPDYMGFIIKIPTSPRNMSPLDVKKIVAEIKNTNKNIKCVGVFQNEPPKSVIRIMKFCDLDIAQLHGNEPNADVQKIRKKYEVWKAFKIESNADKVMLDFKNGSRLNVLAGGLGVANIRNVLKKIQPDVVDANSKLESSPGKKDIRKVKKFIHEIIL